MPEANRHLSPLTFGAVRFQQGGYPGETETVHEMAGAQFIESHYATETRMEMHSHTLPFMHVVLEGSVTNQSERSLETIYVAQVQFYPAHTPHATNWRADGKGFAIQFRSEKAAEWFEWGMLPGQPLTLPPGLVSGLLLSARRECFANDLAGVTGAEGYLAEALAELMRLPHCAGETERPSRRLRWAREILLENYETLPTLTEIARQVDLHPVYLARAFRHAFGETIGDCIRRRRIEAGCRLIVSSDLSLTEIAYAVGFADQSHFTRTFKRNLGIPPTDYARQVRPQKKL